MRSVRMYLDNFNNHGRPLCMSEVFGPQDEGARVDSYVHLMCDSWLISRIHARSVLSLQDS